MKNTIYDILKLLKSIKFEIKAILNEIVNIMGIK